MVNPDRNLYEPPYDDALLYDSDLEPERPRSRPLVVLLGIVVLAAFAGVVWVAYNQGVRQGQIGTTPVLTAETTRVAPPGSDGSPNVAPGKDYTQLPGMGSSEGDATIAPGPEEPRTMPSPQDVAKNTPVTGDAAGGKLGALATDFDPPATVVDPRMDSTTGPLSGAKQIEDITPQLPPVETPTPPVSAPKSLAPTTAAVPPVTKPATVTQSAPTTQKSSTGPKVITMGEAPSTAPTPSETKMAALPPAEEASPPAPKPASASGAIQIQLGSFPSDALAASAWSRIKSSNQDVLGSYSPAFERAEIAGKGTWYRLRVGGFADKTAAADVCEALKANGQACIIAGK